MFRDRLAENKALSCLLLDDNNITSEGLEAFRAGLRTNSSLVELSPLVLDRAKLAMKKDVSFGSCVV